MQWNTFVEHRDLLCKQYEQNNWNPNSGMSLADLGANCLKLLEEMDDLPRITVKAALFRYILEHAQLELFPQDIFADKLNHGNIICNIRNEWLYEVKAFHLRDLIEENETPGSWRNVKTELENHAPISVAKVTNDKRATDADRNADELKQALAGRGFNGNPDFSHAAPAWEDILKLGLPGLLERVQKSRTEKENAGVLTDTQRSFYDACETVYDAMITLMNRYEQEANAIYAQTGNENMKIVGKTCANLAKGAPGSTLEALQLMVSFYTLLTFVEGVGIRSFGCLDELLLPYYQEDIRTGRYTKAQIEEQLRYFYIKFYAMKVLANTPFTLCGMDAYGVTTYSELTDILLDVYGSLNIHDPKIQIRYTEQLPEAFLKKALRLIVRGNSSIVFMNDDVVIRGLCAIGQELQDARKYIPVGCYEPMALGTEVPCSCNGRINIPKAVELAISNGWDQITGEQLCRPRGIAKSWDEFYEIVLDILREFADRSMALINGYERFYPALNPSPLFSATYASCIESGVDAYAGGAKYNNSSINVFGVAEAVDALLVIKHAVFQDKCITLQEMAEVLQNNWEGNQVLRSRCRNSYPRYGNGEAEADLLAAQLVDEVSSMINLKPNGRGGVYRCGGFSIDACEFFGKSTGALPNGRLAGEMLSKNMCAVVGADKNGVTALVQSVTRIDFTKYPNGTVLDIVFHASAVRGEDGLDAVLGVLKTYMDLGGLAIHFNVLDPRILRKAQVEPENYKSLQIRLCGWNVYFVNLNREEQDSFIQRAEHAVS